VVNVNRVRRVIRKVDPWTALKVSFVINFVVALSIVLGLIILWILLVNAGIPQGLEEIAKRLALLDDNASLVGNSEQLFSSVVFFAIFYMVAQTALTTLGVIFYNLVSDIVGGVEVIVLEESYSDQKEVMPKKEERKKSDNRETLAMTFSKTLKKLKDKKEPEPFQVTEEGEEKS
tara:strand:+ start:444 stop:968 length:525 start_codon:yes stop_codon:yes gene_type:complete